MRRSTPEDVASALVPLQRACERLSLPSTVDQRGRHWLSLYSPEELVRGVTQILRQIEGGTRLATPMGLLVSKAKASDNEFFAPAPPMAVITPPLVDQPSFAEDPQATEAVAGMCPEELDRLDQAVRQQVASLLGPSRRRSINGVLGNAEGLAHWRAMVWREQQTLKTGAV